MASHGFVFVQYCDACVEVSLADVARGTQLTRAAYLELGLDKKGLALVDVRLFRVEGGARVLIQPQDTGDRLPSSGSTVEAVLVPVASAGAGAWSGLLRGDYERWCACLCAQLRVRAQLLPFSGSSAGVAGLM